MGWEIAAGWTIVVGSVLLTIGTGAQAHAALAEYREIARTLPEAITAGILMSWSWLNLRVLALFFRPLAELVEVAFQAVAPEIAARLTRLARLTIVWTLLMAGSALVVAGSAIQLALAYTD